MIRPACMSTRQTAQRGSAIIMLFVAVGLFAALAYAFMQGSQTSTSMMTNAGAEAQAQRLIEYGDNVRSAVKRLNLRGCKDNQISFENSLYPTATANSRSPADKRCHVFDPAGGGLRYMTVPPNIMAPESEGNAAQTMYRGHIAFIATGYVEGFGSNDKAEMMMVVPWLSRSVCSAINKSGNAPDYYVGSYWFLHSLGPYLPRATPEYMDPYTGNIARKNYFCGRDGASVSSWAYVMNFILKADAAAN